jgi:hypothetical protein
LSVVGLTVRRIRRLAVTGSPTLLGRSALRELELARSQRQLERDLVSDRPLLVGPFLGEVGYELLYWRPFVLRLLRMHSVDPKRVTVLGRGGTGSWYHGAATGALDAFELLPAEEGAKRMRRRKTPKQLEVAELDRDLIRLARERVGDAVVVHPRHMYWRLRFLWEGLRDPAEASLLGDYVDLPRTSLRPEVGERLPERFVAVKAYFNECVPDADDVRRAVAGVVDAARHDGPVVMLAAPVSADRHRDWSEGGDAAIAELLQPATNLAEQAEIVARASALLSTYGGFSYLGPFLGVPTTAFSAVPETNPLHEQVLRAVRSRAAFERIDLVLEHGEGSSVS